MKPPQTISITQPRVTNQDTDKVYSDKKCNELRDQVVATRQQRDTLAEALESMWPFIEEDDHPNCNTPAFSAAIAKYKAALAVVKGGSDE